MNILINRLIIAIATIVFFTDNSNAAVVERVIAYVDGYAITLSDLKDSLTNARASNTTLTDQEAVEALINRVLLLREARKMKLEGQESSQINEYIEIKIKSLIFIKDEEIQGFYDANSEKFKGVPLPIIKDQIEQYLLEQETNKRLLEHLKELRQRADIKVQVHK